MNSEGRNVLIALLACLGFYFLYTRYMESRYPGYMTQNVAQEDAAEPPPVQEPANHPPQKDPENAATDEMVASTRTEVPRLDDQALTFENADAIFRFNQDQSAIASVQLKHYEIDAKRSGASVELLSSPFIIQGFAGQSQGKPVRDGFHAVREGKTITFWQDQGSWRISQKFSVPDSGYSPDIAVVFENRSSGAVDLQSGVFAFESVQLPESSGGFFSGFTNEQRSLIVGIDGDRESVDAKEYCEDEDERVEAALTRQNENVEYLGFDDHYFLEVLVPQVNRLSFAMKYSPEKPAADGCPILVTMQQAQGLVQPGQSVTLQFRSYFGPKTLDAMRAFDERLTSALYLGWFGAIGRPLLAGLKGLFQMVGNYGVAIILITILLKIFFYPLTRAAVVSMKKMQKLQPQINALRERYKEDPRRQQQEMMKFMSANRINPAKGCLPMLPQIPVFIAFYNVLSHAIELRHAPFYGWIHDLSAADPYYITPILLGIGMFVQQKLSPNPGMDPAQQRILMMMPLIFTVMMLSLPAGLVLYMIVNTVVSIMQQQWLNKRLA